MLYEVITVVSSNDLLDSLWLSFLTTVISVTHWPSVVDWLMATQLGSFVLDVTWLLAGLVFWWPVA